MRKENEKSTFQLFIYPMISLPWLERDRLRTLRETLASRRRTISAAKLQSNLSSSHKQPSSPSLSPSPHRDGEALSNLSSMIARARSGLVQELVEVFNVVEVGGRPPIGGKAGTKGEWTIGDLILPVPGDMRRNLSLSSLSSYNFFDQPSSRLSTRSYQCCSDTHGPFYLAINLLSWCQAPIRSHLDGGKAWDGSAMDWRYQRFRSWRVGKVSCMFPSHSINLNALSQMVY